MYIIYSLPLYIILYYLFIQLFYLYFKIFFIHNFVILNEIVISIESTRQIYFQLGIFLIIA